jgi:alpha-1,2-mannosyltransferase
MIRSPVRPASLAVLCLAAAGAALGASRDELVDLSVYRYAGRAVLQGLPLYGSTDPATGLHVTYPPFAALLMVPLSLLREHLVAALWTGASLAALGVCVLVVRRGLGHPEPRGLLLVAGGLGALVLEPVWQNLTFGQINVLLMLAVLVDLARPDRRYSGVLVGIAAGVKLTPLVFVVLLALVGRRAAAGRATVTFAVTVAWGFAAVPGAASYWSDGLLDASRVGPPALAHNQSLYGVLTRLLGEPPPTLLWVAVAGPVAFFVLHVAATWWRLGDRMLAAGLASLAMLVASPISWSHHWVWAVPLAVVLWERSRWAAVAWTSVFVARPMLWPAWGDGREYAWNAGEQVVGNAYVIAALAVVAWAAVAALHQGSSPPIVGSRTPTVAA